MKCGKISRGMMKMEYGAYIGRILSAIDFPEPPPFEGAIVEIEPGQSIVPHNHHETEIYIILDGKGIMKVEEKSFEVGSGEIIYVMPLENHSLHNKNSTNIRLIALWWEKESRQEDRKI